VRDLFDPTADPIMGASPRGQATARSWCSAAWLMPCAAPARF